jgi:hypothetical protein
MPLGQTVVHSPALVQPPKPASSWASIMSSTRVLRSGWPCGSRPRWATFAAVKSIDEPFGQAATHAPQPMQVAASKAASASAFGIGVAWASGAAPVGAVMYPPAWMMVSKALRSTTRSLITGKAAARHGSTSITSPSLKWRMCSWHVVVARSGPCATPLIIMPHMPQMPSRQSWSKATGSSPSRISFSLRTSSISRKLASGEMSLTS